MDVAEIKKIMDVLNSTDVSEITLESDGTKVSLKKDMVNQIKAKAITPEETNNEPVEEKPENHNILSKNVGKLYFQDKQGEDLVKIGDKIEEGQILGYVKSIGISSELVSDVNGKIMEFLVGNGDNVEYSQPILSVEKE